MTRLPAILLVLCGLLATTPAAAQGKYLFSGDDKNLWIVQSDSDAGTFAIIAKTQGGKWTWVAKDITGSPAAVAAAGGNLHLISTHGAYRRYANRADDEGMPEMNLTGTLLSLCESEGFGPAATAPSPTVIAWTYPSADAARTPTAAPSPAKPAATSSTSPAKAPASNQPGISPRDRIVASQYLHSEWSRITELVGPFSPRTRAYSAVCGGTLYLLLPDIGKDRASALKAWRDDQWQDVPLSGVPAKVAMLGLLSVERRLVVVYAQDAEQGKKTVGLALARSPLTEPFQSQQVTRDGKPAQWDAEELQLAARLDGHVMLLSGRGPAPKLDTCELSGKIISSEDVSTLSSPTQPNYGQQVLQLYFVAMIVLVFLLLIVVRPATPPKRFELPEHIRIASLGKRLAALVLDIVPLFVLSTAIVTPLAPPVPMTNVDMRELVAHPPDAVAYAMVLGITLVVIYGIFMEHRYGATLGKMALGLRVVGEGGRPCKLIEILQRNIVKGVELLWMPFPLLLPLLTRYRQRLGDMVAHTTVVDAESLKNAPPPKEEVESKE